MPALPACRSFVIPIARAAGSLKRLDPDGSEEVILYRTMLDLIKPKLVYLDLPLFMALLSDLFPGVELPPPDGGSLRRAIETELRESNLQVQCLLALLLPQVSPFPGSHAPAYCHS